MVHVPDDFAPLRVPMSASVAFDMFFLLFSPLVDETVVDSPYASLFLPSAAVVSVTESLFDFEVFMPRSPTDQLSARSPVHCSSLLPSAFLVVEWPFVEVVIVDMRLTETPDLMLALVSSVLDTKVAASFTICPVATYASKFLRP